MAEELEKKAEKSFEKARRRNIALNYGSYYDGYFAGAKESKMHMNETERLEEEKCELLGIIQGKDKLIKELQKRIEDLEVMMQEQYPELKQALEWADEREVILLEKIQKMRNCLNCKHFRGINSTCDGCGKTVFAVNCDCSKWGMKE